MLAISVHEAIERWDIPEIFEFIAKDSLASAHSVKNGITATFREIPLQPFIGREYPHEHPLLQGIRMCPALKISGPSSSNYLIFFRPSDDEVRILYVLHAARDISGLMAEDVRK